MRRCYQYFVCTYSRQVVQFRMIRINLEERVSVMKKNNLKLLIPAFAAVLSLSACGGNAGVFPDGTAAADPSATVTSDPVQLPGAAVPASTGAAVTIFDYDMAQYVELGDYLGMTVDFEPTEIDDEYVDYAYMNFVNGYAEAVDPSLFVTDRAVANGDVISLDFCGKKDGVAFDGGTAEGYVIEIGSGTFIDGFEDGLVGVMPGEEIDLNLTFPENYQSADLAGQDVVFTCKVQGIITIDAILETANQNLDEGMDPINDEEDLRNLCREELIRQAAEYDRNNLEGAISAQLANVVTVKQEFPAELTSAYDALVMRSINNTAAYYQVDAETLLSNYGMTVDDYINQYSRPQLMNDAALYIIAKENGILQSDEEFRKSLEEYKAEYQLTDEELFEMLTENEYRVYFLEETTLDFLCDKYMDKM